MKVSVLINNFNYGRFLDDCLGSLANQTVMPFEVILYDDGSTDNSLDIARKYNFVKVISNPNFGLKPSFNQANAINVAFKHSTGDLICLLDSDDFFDSCKIQAIIEAFKANPQAVLVQHAFYEYTDGTITKLGDYAIKNADYKNLYKKKRWTAFFNPTSTLAFSRSYLEKILPILPDEEWKVWPDVRLSRIAPYYGEVICLQEPLTYYRRHLSNDTVTMNSSYTRFLENQIAHHRYINIQLNKLGYNSIQYKTSLQYIKFLIKAYLPAFLVRLLKRGRN